MTIGIEIVKKIQSSILFSSSWYAYSYKGSRLAQHSKYINITGDPRFTYGNAFTCSCDAYTHVAHAHTLIANTIRKQGVDPNIDLLKSRNFFGWNKQSQWLWKALKLLRNLNSGCGMWIVSTSQISFWMKEPNLVEITYQNEVTLYYSQTTNKGEQQQLYLDLVFTITTEN